MAGYRQCIALGRSDRPNEVRPATHPYVTEQDAIKLDLQLGVMFGSGFHQLLLS